LDFSVISYLYQYDIILENDLQWKKGEGAEIRSRGMTLLPEG
jgi:hypothetical protein